MFNYTRIIHKLLTLPKKAKLHTLILKVQSHLLLSNELWQGKFCNFNRNPCNRVFRTRTKEFANVTAP